MGRPPEGSGKKGEPERIRDYPKLLVTIRPAVRGKLRAMAAVENRPAWQIVEDALAMYFDRTTGRKGSRTNELNKDPGGRSPAKRKRTVKNLE